MKLSVIIAIYQSQEVFARQNRYFKKMDLPDEVEFIFVDDGSSPPLEPMGLKNSKIIYTNDKRPWTQGIARNKGVAAAIGENILCTDIDHILSKEAILACLDYKGFRMMFPRFMAYLDQEGNLIQDKEKLIEFGADPDRINSKRGLYCSYHGNTYCMPRELFWFLGGNDESHCQYGHYAPDRKGEDCVMNQRWNRWAYANDVLPDVGPGIYIFPKDRYHVRGESNPFGLFHSLSQELTVQPNKL
jgi:glycosyltransferase involved in cell wall biosynthesis